MFLSDKDVKIKALLKYRLLFYEWYEYQDVYRYTLKLGKKSMNKQ